MYLCIIPARAGSKRIKNKNIKKFLGFPIIKYSIEAAKNSKLFKKQYDFKELLSSGAPKLAQFFFLLDLQMNCFFLFLPRSLE